MNVNVTQEFDLFTKTTFKIKLHRSSSIGPISSIGTIKCHNIKFTKYIENLYINDTCSLV